MEKILDQLIIEAGQVDREVALQIGIKILSEGLPLPASLSELPLTIDEISAIDLFTRAINNVRERCSLDSIMISPYRLHIISDYSYEQFLGKSDGFEMMGQVFMPERLRCKAERLAYVLSHEVSHLTAYMSARIELSDSENEEDKIIISEARQLRTGLQRLNSDRLEFVGLNEATTEYLAFLLRREAAKTSGQFGLDCAQTSDRIMAYVGIASLIIQLTRRLVASGCRPDWLTVPDVWRTILVDYWTGSDVFLTTLAANNLPLWEDLRTLGTDHDDAVRVAVAHGFSSNANG